MSAIKDQILSICNARESALYKMAEDYFHGEDGVLEKLQGCTLPGIAGPIPFQEVFDVAESDTETIHPNYLRWFKDDYLKYLLRIMWKEGGLSKDIAIETKIIPEPVEYSTRESYYEGAEYWHKD